MLFDLTTNTKFDMFIMLFIGLNMVMMAMDHYKPSPQFVLTINKLNIFFVAIFTAECVLKIIALRFHYFKEPWNVFDFVIVVLSILGEPIPFFYYSLSKSKSFKVTGQPVDYIDCESYPL